MVLLEKEKDMQNLLTTNCYAVLKRGNDPKVTIQIYASVSLHDFSIDIYASLLQIVSTDGNCNESQAETVGPTTIPDLATRVRIYQDHLSVHLSFLNLSRADIHAAVASWSHDGSSLLLLYSR